MKNPLRDEASAFQVVLITLGGALLVVVAAWINTWLGLAVFVRGGAYPDTEDVPYNRFLELLENKQIANDKSTPLVLVVEEGRPTQTLRGFYLKQTAGSFAVQPG